MQDGGLLTDPRAKKGFKHRRMGRGGAGVLQPPQNLVNLDFLGGKRNLAKANF